MINWSHATTILSAAAIALILATGSGVAQKAPAPPEDVKPGEEATPPPAPNPPLPAPRPNPSTDTPTTDQPAPEPAPTTPTANAGDAAAIAASALQQTAPLLPTGFADGLDTFTADPANEGAALTLGNAMLSRRQLAPAAWMFANAVATAPDDPVALNNLGMTLAELAQSDLPNQQAELLDAALRLFDQARQTDPNTAAYQANFGHTARLMEEAGLGGPGLAAAREALETAVTLPDALPLHRLHLAEVLAAEGDLGAASMILADIHRENPIEPAYLIGVQGIGGGTGGQSLPAPDRSYCSINYDCQATCPPSIIGRIQIVNCEIAQQDAQLACQAGQPYAPGYNCDEEFPQFGILIPGLNAGFSVRTPWGGFDVLHQGDRVDFRWTFGPGLPGGFRPTVSGDGSWNPSTGLSTGDTRVGITYNVMNGNTVGAEAGRYGLPPIFVRAEADSGGSELSAGVYNGTVWSY
ncbi:MAG: hypothetical protein AAF414_17235 [Pseudomonadota bacterium]